MLATVLSAAKVVPKVKAASGQIAAGKIADGAITTAELAATLRPVQIHVRDAEGRIVGYIGEPVRGASGFFARVLADGDRQLTYVPPMPTLGSFGAYVRAEARIRRDE